MTENTTSKSTNELLMCVIAVESPELFDNRVCDAQRAGG